MTTIWNASDKTANITLSGSNLVATLTTNAAGGVRATTSKSSGKWYYEGTTSGSAFYNYGLGWGNSTASLTTYQGVDTNSVALSTVNTTSALIAFNNHNILSFGGWGINSGPVIQVAFDIGGLLIWFRIGNGLWNNSPSANPATGTGGASVAGIAGGPYFPIFGSDGTNDGVLANFGVTNFSYTPPSGFSGLDTSTQTYFATSSFKGYSAQYPSVTTLSASKFVGYAILVPGTPPGTVKSYAQIM